MIRLWTIRSQKKILDSSVPHLFLSPLEGISGKRSSSFCSNTISWGRGFGFSGNFPSSKPTLYVGLQPAPLYPSPLGPCCFCLGTQVSLTPMHMTPGFGAHFGEGSRENKLCY